MDSTSWNDFSYYSYGKLFHRRGICHSGENLVVVFALATVVFKFCADRWSHSTYVFLGHVYKHEHQILLCEESIQIHEKALSQIIIIKESWRVSNSDSELRFFSSVIESRKFCPSCCRYVKIYDEID